MFILGLTAQPGVGKDTVADYLVRRYGFVKFGFADPLYEEVQLAYGLEGQDLLRDRVTKETPTSRLALQYCRDDEFIRRLADGGLEYNLDSEQSPRRILQLWGTEYRRAQSLNYWLDKSDEFLANIARLYPYPEHRPQHFVISDCRFPNEQAWIRARGGNVWHLHRAGVGAGNDHSSNKTLPVSEGERELWNNDTIERLYIGVDLLMSTHARFVRVEPMTKTEPENVPA